MLSCVILNAVYALDGAERLFWRSTPCDVIKTLLCLQIQYSRREAVSRETISSQEHSGRRPAPAERRAATAGDTTCQARRSWACRGNGHAWAFMARVIATSCCHSSCCLSAGDYDVIRARHRCVSCFGDYRNMRARHWICNYFDVNA